MIRSLLVGAAGVIALFVVFVVFAFLVAVSSVWALAAIVFMRVPKWVAVAALAAVVVCLGYGLAHAGESPQAFWAHENAKARIGLRSNVLAEAERFLGGGNPTGFRGPWCKAFTNTILRRVGFHPGPSLLAIDALRDGHRVGAPSPGDLAVMRGHVTFFVRFDGSGGFIGLGGNQGHRVRLSRFALRSVVGFVRPI